MRKDQKSESPANDRLIVQAPVQPMVPQGRVMYISYPDLNFETALAMTMNALESGCKVVVLFRDNDRDFDRFRAALDMAREDVGRDIWHRLSTGNGANMLRVEYAPKKDGDKTTLETTPLRGPFEESIVEMLDRVMVGNADILRWAAQLIRETDISSNHDNIVRALWRAAGEAIRDPIDARDAIHTAVHWVESEKKRVERQLADAAWAPHVDGEERNWHCGRQKK